MDVFREFIAHIEDPGHRDRVEGVLQWVVDHFPDLEGVIKWNQPIFTHHGTYIMGFSVAKGHLAIGPEAVGIDHFSHEIGEAGFQHSKMLVRVRWDQEMDYALLARMIAYNMTEKANCTSFWRKED